ADEVAREVLLADLDVAALPAVADLFQGGQHHVAQRLLHAERSQALVERRVSGDLVVAVDRPEQASGGVLEQTLGRALVCDCDTGGLGGRETLVESAPHTFYARGVRGGIDAETPRPCDPAR